METQIPIQDSIRQMPSRVAGYFRKHPPNGLQQNEIELHKHDNETLSELRALKELIELYARAAIAQDGQTLKLLLEILEKNIQLPAPTQGTR